MIVVGIKTFYGDMYPEHYQKQLMVFNNQEEAYALLRRNIRDMYIAGDFNMDEMMEKSFVVIADFDDETGKFENKEQQIHMDVESMIYDLIGENENDS